MANVKTVNGLARANIKTRNGLASANIKTINGVDAVVAGGGTTYTYHRVDLRAQGTYVSLVEMKFTLDDDSEYTLGSTTITTTTSWEYAALSIIHNGTVNETPTHGNVGTNNWANIKIQVPSPVSVKEVLVATQVNYNGPYNMGNGLRYYTSTDGTTWDLVKEILGGFSTASGFLTFNVEP